MSNSCWSKTILAALIAVASWTWQPAVHAVAEGWQAPKRQDGPTVFVVGRVRQAGRYRFKPGMTVADAISAAGGARVEAPLAIEIRRKTADGVEIKPAALSDTVLANDTVAVTRRSEPKGRPQD